MWQSSPGTKLSMTVGNCNLGDICLSAWDYSYFHRLESSYDNDSGKFWSGKKCVA